MPAPTPRRRTSLPHVGRVRTPVPLVATLALAAVIVTPLSAQYPSSPPQDGRTPMDVESSWGQEPRLSFGVGQGSEGVALLAMGTLVAGPGDVMVRMSHTGLLDAQVGDMALLYGMRAATPGERLSARLGAGVGWVDLAYDGPEYNCRTENNMVGLPPLFLVQWESTDCDQDRIQESGLGVAFQLDTTVGITAAWGLSVAWFANVGGPRGYNGFAVSFLRAL